MADAKPLGQLLIQSAFPRDMGVPDRMDKKTLNQSLVDLGMRDNEQYRKTVTELKRIGDDVATYDGISVGLDDIEPIYSQRDAVLSKHFNAVRSAKTDDDKRKGILKAQDDLLAITKKHPGDMGLMVRSGGRGNAPQLMKAVTAPIAATDWDGNIVPWFIKRSYAEGLSPSEWWVTGAEARKNAIMGVSSVIEPGEIGKLMTWTVADQVISDVDCGTHNGIMESTRSANVVDRYLAKDHGRFKRNTLITPQIQDTITKAFDKVLVRSPMTCEQHQGICQRCYGNDAVGKEPQIGTNVGMRGAHAMSEPLTQAMLSSKHAAGVAKKETKELEGFKGVKTFIEVPRKFTNAAVLAQEDGSVTQVKKAPQGGHYIHVNGSSHYAPPNLELSVKVGDVVEAGDALTDGIPKPNDVMRLKGIGVGRKYYADKLHAVFEKSVSPMDKRHIEVLAKAQLSHATVEDDPKNMLLRGDIVDFNSLRKRLAEDTKTIPIESAKDEMLAEAAHEYLAGTRVTPSILRELKSRGVSTVTVAIDPPALSFVMKPLTYTPALDPDWIARMAHRDLKSSILSAAATGEKSNIHGYNPVPGFVYGAEFGKGLKGAY